MAPRILFQASKEKRLLHDIKSPTFRSSRDSITWLLKYSRHSRFLKRSLYWQLTLHFNYFYWHKLFFKRNSWKFFCLNFEETFYFLVWMKTGALVRYSGWRIRLIIIRLWVRISMPREASVLLHFPVFLMLNKINILIQWKTLSVITG